ncbi:hypothetical protein GF413_03635 [Candidatus Micrarchaeota archaeon]|nr:hypothetical protein [Candidatus Micrarchaeota archaeon]
MATMRETITVYLKTNTQIPKQHYYFAMRRFYNQSFDYYAGARGYEVHPAPGDKCKVSVTGPFSDNNDDRPDVECFAGLVKTSADILQADWDGYTYMWNPYQVQVGDVIKVQLRDYDGNEIKEKVKLDSQSTLTSPYGHFMFVTRLLTLETRKATV